MRKIVEKINNYNLETIKCMHRIKNYDDFYINDSLNIVKEGIFDVFNSYIKETGNVSKFDICEERVTQINKLKGSTDKEKIVNLLESIIKKQNQFKEDYIKEVVNKETDYYKLLEELYYDIENILYESYADLLYKENEYIESLINNICAVTEVNVGGAVKTTVKGANKTFKGAVKVWETILNFINKIKELFMSKIKKIQERDAEWLKQNKKTLLKVNTENKEVNIHSDYAVPFSSSKSTMQSFRNMVKSNSKVTDYEVFKSKLTAFTTQDGDLKTGLTNKFRTGSTNKEYGIKTISGKPISNTIDVL